jgi:hypothetical protein
LVAEAAPIQQYLLHAFSLLETNATTIKQIYTTDPTLANHTLHHPKTPHPHLPLPVLVWGNGGCMNNGTAFATFLTKLASHRYLVIASGPPDGTGMTNSQLMDDAISWVTGRPGRSPSGPYRTIDANRIAVAGQSCGGLEAYQMRDEERVKGLGIFNSGFIEGGGGGGSAPGFPNEMEDPSVIGDVHKPVFWFLGGEEDVAYPNVSSVPSLFYFYPLVPCCGAALLVCLCEGYWLMSTGHERLRSPNGPTKMGRKLSRRTHGDVCGA